MKKKYEKPVAYAERFIFETPIAANCTIDPEDLKHMQILGYFGSDSSCEMCLEEGDPHPFDKDEDTICYNSNISNVFTS